jgi:hypothetical protein
VKLHRFLTCLYLLVLSLVAEVAVAMPEPLPIAEVVEMSRAGNDPAVINATVARRRTSFALRGSDFGRLADAGVAPAVLDQLQQDFMTDVGWIVRRWANGAEGSWCPRCYPWEVDLAALPDTTGIRQTAAPRSMAFGRAQGLPSWYRPVRGSLTYLGIEDIRQMLAAGKPADDVREALSRARLKGVIGVTGLKTLGTIVHAGLTGATLAQLHKEGVPDALLDEIQLRYLAEVVENLRLRNVGEGRGR